MQKLLTEMKCEIDLIGILNALEHGLTLPPGLFVVVEVGEIGGRVWQRRIGGIT